jgi:hypothetical protein
MKYILDKIVSNYKFDFIILKKVWMLLNLELWLRNNYSGNYNE